jgi:predicted GIY-YIG superfamily endonuclease
VRINRASPGGAETWTSYAEPEPGEVVPLRIGKGISMNTADSQATDPLIANAAPGTDACASARSDLAARTTALYRLYDDGAHLLYVGIARDPQQRMDRHQPDHWLADIAAVGITLYPYRQQAKATETKAIKTEWPLWNIHQSPPVARQGTLPPPPSAPRRCATDHRGWQTPDHDLRCRS